MFKRIDVPRHRRTRRIAAATLLLSLALGTAGAEDRVSEQPQRTVRNTASHFGASPFTPPRQADTRFVVDQSPGLDTGCAFRGQGPLLIDIPVDRFVGAVDASGALRDPAQLIANRAVSAEARLFLPAFDVDFSGSGSSAQPERDRVTLNGTPLEPVFLTGANDVWKLNAFRIPISLLRFPDDPGAGETITPRTNTLRIDIDTANSAEVWCTEVDWVALEIEASRPVLLVHGILSSGATWEARWVPGLDDHKVLNDRLDLGSLDSIQDNAGDIAVRVEELRRRWGVDKVNLVAHSKGGIDSRHYAENRDTVEKLLQIGTPNAGSVLADYAQGSLVVFSGLVGSLLANTFAGPAGVQLTRPYMAGYNLLHGANPQVEYVALAGDYSGAPFFSVDRFLGALIDGPDDVIVPVSSVHALSFTENRTLTTTGGDLEAKHVRQTGAGQIFNNLIGKVQTFGSRAGAAGPDCQRTGTWADSIALGEALTRQIPIDGNGTVFLSLLHEGGDLDLAVITPQGVRIDAHSNGGLAGAGHGSSEILEGLHLEVVTLEQPVAGQYTLEVTARQVTNPSGEEPFFASGWIPAAEVVLDGRIARPSLRREESLTVDASLTEAGQPKSGASLVVHVLHPDGGRETVALAESGGGQYRALLPAPLAPGVHRLTLQATGVDRAGAAFSREVFLLATVAESGSRITGPYSDTGLDDDDDGLFDRLRIDVGLEVTTAGRYSLLGELTDGDGQRVLATARAAADLPVGAATLALDFDGAALFGQGVNGPYLLRLVRLAEESSGELDAVLVDEQRDVHRTAAYDVDQFQHAALRLTGTSRLLGVDDDGDGRFDRLRAVLEVDATTAGDHQWSARLVGPGGDEIAFANGAGPLAEGRSEIVLEFPGCAIGTAGQDGVLSVQGLLLFGDAGSLADTGTAASGQFAARQFACGPITATEVPTLGEWGLLALAGGLLLAGWTTLRRRPSAT